MPTTNKSAINQQQQRVGQQKIRERLGGKQLENNPSYIISTLLEISDHTPFDKRITTSFNNIKTAIDSRNSGEELKTKVEAAVFELMTAVQQLNTYIGSIDHTWINTALMKYEENTYNSLNTSLSKEKKIQISTLAAAYEYRSQANHALAEFYGPMVKNYFMRGEQYISNQPSLLEIERQHNNYTQQAESDALIAICLKPTVRVQETPAALDNHSTAANYIAQGMTFYRQGNISDGFFEFTLAAAMEPQNPQALFGLIYHDTKNKDAKALESYRNLSRIENGFTPEQTNMLQTLRTQLEHSATGKNKKKKSSSRNTPITEEKTKEDATIVLPVSTQRLNDSSLKATSAEVNLKNDSALLITPAEEQDDWQIVGKKATIPLHKPTVATAKPPVAKVSNQQQLPASKVSKVAKQKLMPDTSLLSTTLPVAQTATISTSVASKERNSTESVALTTSSKSTPLPPPELHDAPASTPISMASKTEEWRSYLKACSNNHAVYQKIYCQEAYKHSNADVRFLIDAYHLLHKGILTEKEHTLFNDRIFHSTPLSPGILMSDPTRQPTKAEWTTLLGIASDDKKRGTESARSSFVAHNIIPTLEKLNRKQRTSILEKSGEILYQQIKPPKEQAIYR